MAVKEIDFEDNEQNFFVLHEECELQESLEPVPDKLWGFHEEDLQPLNWFYYF